MKRLNPPRRPAAAFTLIELLVVIAIIALLAAILFPVFARAREQGRKAACLSNLRQIGIAMNLYTADYDSSYPNTGDPYLWVGQRFRFPIMPYLGVGQKQGANFTSVSGPSALLLCPSDTTSETSYDATSYCYSAAFYHTPAQVDALTVKNLIAAIHAPGAGATCVTQTEADVITPSKKMVVAEWFNSHDHGLGAPIGIWGTVTAALGPGADCKTGGRNAAFADGHAAFVFASRQVPNAGDNCPDMNRTPGGVSGSDLP